MITVQQIITQVKSIKGGLAGISRTNRPLWQQLRGKCEKLEKELVSCCDKLMVGSSNDGNSGLTSPELLDSYQALQEDYTALQLKHVAIDIPYRILNAEGEGEFVNISELLDKYRVLQETNSMAGQIIEAVKATHLETLSTLTAEACNDLENSRKDFVGMLEDDSLSKAEILNLFTPKPDPTTYEELDTLLAPVFTKDEKEPTNEKVNQETEGAKTSKTEAPKDPAAPAIKGDDGNGLKGAGTTTTLPGKGGLAGMKSKKGKE